MSTADVLIPVIVAVEPSNRRGVLVNVFRKWVASIVNGVGALRCVPVLLHAQVAVKESLQPEAIDRAYVVLLISPSGESGVLAIPPLKARALLEANARKADERSPNALSLPEANQMNALAPSVQQRATPHVQPRVLAGAHQRRDQLITLAAHLILVLLRP
jgi:hypothetical protein